MFRIAITIKLYINVAFYAMFQKQFINYELSCFESKISDSIYIFPSVLVCSNYFTFYIELVKI